MNFKEEEIKELTEKIIKETKMMEGVLQFIQDFGAYKERSKYKLSDHDYKAKLRQFKAGITLLQTNVIVAEYVIGDNKKLWSKYETAMNLVMKEAEKKILAKREGSVKSVKLPKKHIIH